MFGVGLQTGALLLAPLTAVQPAEAAGLVFPLYLGARNLGERVGRSEIIAVASIAFGIVGLTIAAPERQITNVAAGTQGTDAVNVNQLNQSTSGTLKQANDYTDSKTEGTRRDAYAGTASALAVAGLPQAVLPGRGMVALGGGTYGGQSAVAIGVSQLSENGIWACKVSGTTSTRGQFGVSVGAGMHW